MVGEEDADGVCDREKALLRRRIAELEMVASNYDDLVRALRASERRYQHLANLVRQTADAVVVTDRNGQIEYVNPAFVQMTGYSREEALGQTPAILKSGCHDRVFYQTLWEVILSGNVYHGRLYNRKKTAMSFVLKKPLRRSRARWAKLPNCGFYRFGRRRRQARARRRMKM